MKRWLSALCLALAIGLAAAPILADDTDGLPVSGGTAAEIGPGTVTQDWPWVRTTFWCASPTVACLGTVTVDAQTCPTCPWRLMASKANPDIPDVNGRVSSGHVVLHPRMYAYRCTVGSDYNGGKFACHIERIK